MCWVSVCLIKNCDLLKFNILYVELTWFIVWLGDRVVVLDSGY